ncbi:MAG: hypothetical protein QM766_08575 [Burkholderiaceae bacterium]
MTYRTGTARAAWRITFMDTTLTLRTPLDALEQALGTRPNGAVVTAKLLYCELARHGYLGEEADLIVGSAVQSQALTPILDRQMRSAFVVSHARLASLRGTVDGWRRTFRRGSPSVA